MKKNKENIDDAILLKVIENEADEKEKILFREWYASSEENAETYAQLSKTYNITSLGKHSLQENWNKVVQKANSGGEIPGYIQLPEIEKVTKILKINFLFKAAAVLVVLLGMSLFLKYIVFSPEQLIVSGESLKAGEPCKMADGSLVYLNGKSKISFLDNFGANNREISLDGEAFFEVKPNPEIPFMVKTNKAIIKVVGTSFNVYSDSSEMVKVTVVSGIVEIFAEKTGELIKLEKGQQGVYNPLTGKIEKTNIENPNFQAWKTGVFVFNETPVLQVFNLLQSYYQKTLIYKQKSGSMPIITTTIDNQPLDAVLEELNLLLNTKVETINDTICFKPID